MTINIERIQISDLIPHNDMTLPNPPHGHASVLVPLLCCDGQWHILLTLRASHLRHHGGEVAFPGGMWESSDHSPIATALRESEEEIALSSDQVQVLGGLKEVCTRRMTWVRPVVGILSDTLSLQPNPDEIAALFTVPISFFRQDQRLRTDLFLRERGGKEQRHWVPAYQFGEYEIWGFTAAVIIELMNRCFTANIGRENSAPEKIW